MRRLKSLRKARAKDRYAARVGSTNAGVRALAKIRRKAMSPNDFISAANPPSSGLVGAANDAIRSRAVGGPLRQAVTAFGTFLYRPPARLASGDLYGTPFIVRSVRQ